MVGLITEPEKTAIVGVEVRNNIHIGLRIPHFQATFMILQVLDLVLLVKVIDDLYLLCQTFPLLAHLKSLHLGLLCVIFQDKVLEPFEVKASGETGDVIEPHAHDSIAQHIKKTVFWVLLEVTKPNLVILFGLFSHVGVYLLSVGDHSSGNCTSE